MTKSSNSELNKDIENSHKEREKKAKEYFQKYIDKSRELQKLVLQIIENQDQNMETDFQDLTNFLDENQYKDNKKELERFLHLILIISQNHHRLPYFFENIEKILIISSKLKGVQLK